MEARAQDILSEGLGDSNLTGLRWVNDGQDLILDFSTPENEILSLRFVWVYNLKIDMTFGEYGGLPLLFESNFQRQDEKTWVVDLDFAGAPNGGIAFNCSDVEIVR